MNDTLETQRCRAAYMLQRSAAVLLTDLRGGSADPHSYSVSASTEADTGEFRVYYEPLAYLLFVSEAIRFIETEIVTKLDEASDLRLGIQGSHERATMNGATGTDRMRALSIARQRVGRQRQISAYPSLRYVLGFALEMCSLAKVLCDYLDALQRRERSVTLNPVLRVVLDRAATLLSYLESNWPEHCRHLAGDIARVAIAMIAQLELSAAGKSHIPCVPSPDFCPILKPEDDLELQMCALVRDWRRRNSFDKISLGPGVQFQMQPRRHAWELYELWAFLEIASAAKIGGIANFSQNTLIHQRRCDPLFVLAGLDVFYGWRPKMPKQKRSPGLGFRVDWLMRDRQVPARSIVLEAKFNGLNQAPRLPAAVHQTLGYMARLGVDRGVAIVCEAPDHADSVRVRSISCPKNGRWRFELLVASLFPSKTHERSNQMQATEIAARFFS